MVGLTLVNTLVPVPTELIDRITEVIPNAGESNINSVCVMLLINRDIGLKFLQLFKLLQGKTIPFKDLIKEVMV